MNKALSQADLAFQAIEERVVTLELAPGSRVTEQQLRDMTGLGRTPVREALLRLAQGYLIEILPRNGIYIRPIDYDVIMMTLEVRRSVERLIVQRAARYADDRERRQFGVLRERFQDATERADAVAFMRADHAFNQLLNTSANHEVAAKIVGPLHSVSRRMGFVLGRDAGAGFNKTGPEHINLIDAVVAGDEAAGIHALDVLLDDVTAIARELSHQHPPT